MAPVFCFALAFVGVVDAFGPLGMALSQQIGKKLSILRTFKLEDGTRQLCP